MSFLLYLISNFCVILGLAHLCWQKYKKQLVSISQDTQILLLLGTVPFHPVSFPFVEEAYQSSLQPKLPSRKLPSLCQQVSRFFPVVERVFPEISRNLPYVNKFPFPKKTKGSLSRLYWSFSPPSVWSNEAYWLQVVSVCDTCITPLAFLAYLYFIGQHQKRMLFTDVGFSNFPFLLVPSLILPSH